MALTHCENLSEGLFAWFQDQLARWELPAGFEVGKGADLEVRKVDEARTEVYRVPRWLGLIFVEEERKVVKTYHHLFQGEKKILGLVSPDLRYLGIEWKLAMDGELPLATPVAHEGTWLEVLGVVLEPLPEPVVWGNTIVPRSWTAWVDSYCPDQCYPGMYLFASEVIDHLEAKKREILDLVQNHGVKEDA